MLNLKTFSEFCKNKELMDLIKNRVSMRKLTNIDFNSDKIIEAYFIISLKNELPETFGFSDETIELINSDLGIAYNENI